MARDIQESISRVVRAKTHVSRVWTCGPWFSPTGAGYAAWMDDKDAPQRPETAEDEDESKLSEKLPDALSGKGKTPLGSSDEHSDAPGSTGEG